MLGVNLFVATSNFKAIFVPPDTSYFSCSPLNLIFTSDSPFEFLSELVLSTSSPFLYNTAYWADFTVISFGNFTVTVGFLYKSLLSSFDSSVAFTVIVWLSAIVEIFDISKFIFPNVSVSFNVITFSATFLFVVTFSFIPVRPFISSLPYPALNIAFVFSIFSVPIFSGLLVSNLTSFCPSGYVITIFPSSFASVSLFMFAITVPSADFTVIYPFSPKIFRNSSLLIFVSLYRMFAVFSFSPSRYVASFCSISIFSSDSSI